MTANGLDAVSGTVPQVIKEFGAGQRSAADLVASIRQAVLVLPISDADEVLVGDARGLGWVYAFTSLPELARFARARDAAGRSWPYVSMRGSLVLDHVLTGTARPCGLAIDVTSAYPILLPPVDGVMNSGPLAAPQDSTGCTPPSVGAGQ